MTDISLDGKIFIVTGGARGLGRAMVEALLDAGAAVTAAGNIADDLAELSADIGTGPAADRLHTVTADIRQAKDCRSIVDETRDRHGGLHGLINNAGLLFTYIYPGKWLRDKPQKFWETTDEIVQNVMDTNFVAHDRMTRLCVPHLVEQGWGRIINVTTKLDTMNREGSSPYGASKAALEMSSEVWKKDLEGTGVTVNILNPGGAADTAGFATDEEKKVAAQRIPLMSPAQMGAPAAWLCSDQADHINGQRFDAQDWDASQPPADEAVRQGRPLGFELKPKP